MGIGSVGFPQVAIILLVLLLLFGAKRLPEIGSSLGKGIRTFKTSVTGEDEAVETGQKEVAVKSGEETK